jgi:imidazole glycerol-phosphate synthase subunit HisF
MKKKVRLISRLDIKAPNLIKGINLEGVRVVGDPHEYAIRYFREGIDELLYMDSVATLYGRNNLISLVRETADNVFVPMTVGGGLRSLENVDEVMRAGADKVSINSAAIRRPAIITEVARRYGAQAMVLSVEAKKRGVDSGWEAYIDNGREKTGLDVIEWVKRAVLLGAGEILVTSVDKEGMRRGFDIDLMRAVTDVVDVPVIASGGMGKLEDASAVIVDGGADAVAMADVLHYNRIELKDVRNFLATIGVEVTPHDNDTYM